MNNLFLLSSAATLLLSCSEGAQEPKPNILWITIEDWSTDLGCYGTPGIETPNIDKLASEGILYTNAYATAPVSSASRSAMMTGYYQNFVGGNQHRLKPDQKRPLPDGVRPMPHLMKDAGYYTQLMSWKTDCNFTPFTPGELFEDTRHWEEWDGVEPFFKGDRAEGQPFFARITFSCTHRAWDRDPIRPISTDDVELPPYYADTDFNRRDWANGLEQMQICDRQVGELLDYIDEAGLRDNTIVVFIADNGRCHIRGKQFLYEGGVKLPMIVRWPTKIEAGQTVDEMVSTLDICKTFIDIAGAKPAIPYHGLNLFDDDLSNREYLFASRDKMDETHDAMRAVRSKDGFKLIHNLMPERPYLQFNQYKEASYPMLAEMNYLYLTGQLNEVQSQFMASTKPDFELYDLNSDPYEINNLANDPQYAEVKKILLAALNDWRKNVILDKGVSDTFRALNVFPKDNPYSSVDEFVKNNKTSYDYRAVGWPSWYPTRSTDEWKVIRNRWLDWIYRDANSDVKRPHINVSTTPKKK